MLNSFYQNQIRIVYERKLLINTHAKDLNKTLANPNQTYAKSIIYVTKLGMFQEYTHKIRQKLKSYKIKHWQGYGTKSVYVILVELRRETITQENCGIALLSLNNRYLVFYFLSVPAFLYYLFLSSRNSIRLARFSLFSSISCASLEITGSISIPLMDTLKYFF